MFNFNYFFKSYLFSLFTLLATYASAQERIFSTSTPTLYSYLSTGESGQPTLTWYTLDTISTHELKLFRKPINTDEYKEINTLLAVFHYNDTMYVRITDTLSIEQNIYEYYLQANDKHGQSFSCTKLYGHNLGDIPSPSIISFESEPVASEMALQLTYKLNYHQTVKSLLLYRSRYYDGDYEFIKELSATSISYKDVVDQSNEAFYYFIVVNDIFGHSKPSVRIHGIARYSDAVAPPQNIQVKLDGNQHQLSWRKLSSQTIGYYVMRKTNEENSFRNISGLLPTREEYIDWTDTTNIDEWTGGGSVFYYIQAVGADFKKSIPSDTLVVDIPSTELLNAPTDLTVSKIAIGMKLIFDIKKTAYTAVDYYHVYRKVNSDEWQLITTKKGISFDQNYYVDSFPPISQTIEYAVQSFSLDGNTSQKHAAIFKDYEPIEVQLSCQLEGAAIRIHWSDGMNKNLSLWKIIEGGSPFPLVLNMNQSSETFDVDIQHRDIVYFVSDKESNILSDLVRVEL